MIVLPAEGKRFYAALGLTVAYLELVGTAAGTWVWAPEQFGLAEMNPPSGAVGGYSLIDGAAFLLAAARELRLRGRGGVVVRSAPYVASRRVAGRRDAGQRRAVRRSLPDAPCSGCRKLRGPVTRSCRGDPADRATIARRRSNTSPRCRARAERPARRHDRRLSMPPSDRPVTLARGRRAREPGRYVRRRPAPRTPRRRAPRSGARALARRAPASRALHRLRHPSGVDATPHRAARATAIPASHPGARPPGGGRSTPLEPALVSSHGSPSWSSTCRRSALGSRPQTSAGTRVVRSSRRSATARSPVSAARAVRRPRRRRGSRRSASSAPRSGTAAGAPARAAADGPFDGDAAPVAVSPSRPASSRSRERRSSTVDAPGRVVQVARGGPPLEARQRAASYDEAVEPHEVPARAERQPVEIAPAQATSRDARGVHARAASREIPTSGRARTTRRRARRCAVPGVRCGRRDSNPHGLRHRHLKPACLPIPPRPLVASGRAGL